jgi:hypothetical protein
MRDAWEQLASGGELRGALELATATGELFSAGALPQFFTGDLDARFVLVHLNPKQHDTPWAQDHPKASSFEEYVLAQRWFGRDHYGPDASAWHSPFDHKQIRFLQPFGLIEFVSQDQDGRPAALINLERVVDEKLQLELIPYASSAFRTGKLRRILGILEPHHERMVSVIAATPRDYIIFCGSIFEDLLDRHIVDRRPHTFLLKKADGTLMRQTSRFSLITLRTPNGRIRAGIAHSWARQGIPMRAYAEEIKARYPSPTA